MTTRNPTFYLHGTSADSHVFQIDGVDVMSAIQNNDRYMNLSTEAIADIQVKTSAVDASSPLGLGLVVNLASVSGSDRLRGTSAFVWQPQFWNDTNGPAGSSQSMAVKQLDFSLGGPVLRGRSWFYTSHRYGRSLAGLSRSPRVIQVLRALEPGFDEFEPSIRDRYSFLKSTTQLTPTHQLAALYSNDERSEGSTDALAARDFNDRTTGGPLLSAKWSSTWTNSFLTRVLLSYNWKRTLFDPRRTDVPGRTVHERVFLSGGRLLGSGAIARLDNSTAAGFEFPASKSTLSVDAIFFHPAWFGSHEVQAGFFAQPRLHDEWVARYHAGGFQQEEVVLVDPQNPGAGVRPFHRQIFEVDRLTTQLVDSRDVAAYLQDLWRPSNRLTVAVGVRVDWIRRMDRLFNRVTQDSVEIGPRFGATFLVTSDARNVVHGSWGLVHENLSVNQTTAGTNVAGVRDLYDLNLDGIFETAFVTPGRRQAAGNGNIQVDLDHYHQSFADEWTAGYRRQWPQHVTTNVTLIRRSYRDRPAAVEVNGIYDGGVFR
ncbi:MAG: hypothetical protein ACREA0_13035, partial [bacterium]